MIQSPFQFLVGEISKINFLTDYFNKQPLLNKGKIGKFDNFFSLADFNRILNNIPLEYPRVRVTNHQNTIHKYDLIDDKDRYENNINNQLNLEKVMLAIAKGGTLVVDRIHEFHEPLEDFTDKLAHELNLRVSINGYYTHAGQDGVNVHFDRHDVLAIQIHGSKRWYYRHDDHILARPMRHQTAPIVDKDTNGWKSVLLEEGDVFYCPRGVWHFTRTNEQPSTHIALGFHPLTVRDWMRRLEQEPKIAELLEEYVCQPFQQDGTPINAESVIAFLDAATVATREPLSVNLKPRSYMELE